MGKSEDDEFVDESVVNEVYEGDPEPDVAMHKDGVQDDQTDEAEDEGSEDQGDE